MTKFIRTLFWAGLLWLMACQPDREERPVDFSTYLEQERLWAEAETLYAEGKWELARTQYSRVFLVERAMQSQLRQAACLLQRERRPEAQKAIEAAILEGASLQDFSDPVFSPVQPRIDSLYRELHPAYEASLDTALRREVRQILLPESAFFPPLQALVSTHGWPDCWLVGCEEGLQEQLVQRITTGDEAANRFFLSHILQSASRNRASWHSAQVLMKNLCTHYLEQNQARVKLWQVQSGPDGHLDLEASLLQLHTLAEVYRGKIAYLELYAPQYEGEEAPVAGTSLLEAIRDYLVSQGLDPILVGVNPYPVEESGERYVAGLTVAR